MEEENSGKNFVVFNSWKQRYHSGSHSLPNILNMHDRDAEFSNTLVEEIITFIQRASSILKVAMNKGIYEIDDLSWSANLLEKALNNIRLLSYAIKDDAPNSDQLSTDRLFISPTSVKMTDTYIKFDFPILMRKRRAGTKTHYYDLSLKEALNGMTIPSQYTSQNITMIFLHCYKKEHVNLVRKDHDNIDLKWIIDALNNYFFIDDGPLRTCLFQNSIVDDSDHTIIYLVPTSHLGEFLTEKIPEWEQRREVTDSSESDPNLLPKIQK